MIDNDIYGMIYPYGVFRGYKMEASSKNGLKITKPLK